MKNNKSSKSLIRIGIITAIAASLCCIAPVLALFAGVTGIASAFSWLEPARPYLIIITLLVIGFAWYQKLKPRTKEEIECACEDDEKPKFFRSKKFLGIVTVFVVLMLAFPYYSQIFFPTNEKEVIIVDSSNIQIAEFKISGMTCKACEEEVKYEVNKLNGIIKTEVFYEKGTAEIQFDKSKTTIEEIIKAINATGYTVTESEIKK